MSSDKGRIHPGRQVVMRLPDTDPNKDPWTGAAIDTGRNLPDETPIDENVPLLPPLGKTSAQIEAELTELIRPEDFLKDRVDEVTDRDWVQFTLGDILILMTAAGVALGGVRFLSPAVFALGAGVITVVFLAIVNDRQISRARFRTIVIGLLTIYVISTATAIVTTMWAA